MKEKKEIRKAIARYKSAVKKFYYYDCIISAYFDGLRGLPDQNKFKPEFRKATKNMETAGKALSALVGSKKSNEYMRIFSYQYQHFYNDNKLYLNY